MLRMLAAEAARRFGERVAVQADGVQLTYRELDRLSDAVAAGYAHRGVRMGDIVAIALPAGPEFVACTVAAAKIGAVAAGIDRPGRSSFIERLRPELVITPGDLLDRARTPYESLGALVRPERPPPPLPPDQAQPSMITFTSGRTGPPKAVLFGGRQLEAIRAVGAGVRWGGGDARLIATSPAHASFLTRLPVMLQTGRTAHFLPEWTCEGALRVITDEEISIVQGSPDQLGAFLEHPAPRGTRLVLVSGAPVTPELVRRLREHFAAPVCNRYLCTEAGLGLGTQPGDPPEDAEFTVGRPRPGVDLAIRDPSGADTWLNRPAGEEGEVLLRSGAVMTGYVGEDRRAFTGDGFVRTGDIGFVDQDGRLRLTGSTP